jgi:hypothetical protein
MNNSDSLRAGRSGDRIPLMEGWEEIFLTRPDRPGVPPSLLYKAYRVFAGVKPAQEWRGVDHPPRSNAEVKERVELYICSPSGPSWPVLW